jgi:hypothetical protein
VVIPTWISGPLAIVAVYWCLTLATRPSRDGTNFRPAAPVRLVYPAVLTGFLVMIPFGVSYAFAANRPLPWNEMFAICALPVFCVVLAITWPPTITVTDNGLRWRRLLVRRFIEWSEIEGVSATTDERAVIYCRTGKQYEVSGLIQGHRELAAIVRQHLTETQS